MPNSPVSDPLSSILGVLCLPEPNRSTGGVRVPIVHDLVGPVEHDVQAFRIEEQPTLPWAGAALPSMARAIGRQISPVPLDGVAADPVLRQRSCAARCDVETVSEPSQVQGQFQALH